ncbi:hypothetical protein [Pararhodobacter sp.]|uniref:hypothetical protein n=1 Tax=Pararhodobacter sp. TaxID=2127056 RepID=UPI002AFF13E7|nr:hypothetical protein [Pararhodobacter sp.]
MRNPLFAALVGMLLAAPLAAQTPDPAPRDLGGLLRDMVGLLDPYLGELAEMLGDLSGWHAPEFLENGDILIRRRQSEADSETAPETAPSDEDEAPILEPLEL